MTVLYVKEGCIQELTVLKNNSTYTLMLWKNNLTPDRDTEYVDLTEADFSGYVAVSVTFGAVTIDGSGNATMTGNLCQFVHNGGATGNNVYGWALVYDYAATPVVIHIERFAAAPRVMTNNLDEIDITPRKTQGVCP